MIQLKHKNNLIQFILVTPFIVIILYILIASLMSYIPLNRKFTPTSNGIDIFVQSNGVHTDLVLPAVTSQVNWKTHIPASYDFRSLNQTLYISFGWGNKDFYINTPTLQDLKFNTAMKAVLGIGSSVIHTTYYKSPPKEGESTIKIRISKGQYKTLSEYIKNSFLIDSLGKFQMIPGFHYTKYDSFYEAHGSYNLFKTCNTWTGDALKQAGIRTACWSPFEWGIMRQVKKIGTYPPPPLK